MSDTTTSTLAAALWDFDGTLADTEPLWIAAEYDLINQLGGTWSEEHAEQLVGNSLLDSGSYILNAIGRVDLSPAWVVEQLLTDRRGPHPAAPDRLAPRGDRAARVLRRGGCSLRIGIGVVPGAAGRGPQPTARGNLPGIGGGGRSKARQATSGAVREGVYGPWASPLGIAWSSKTPRRAAAPATPPERWWSPCPTAWTSRRLRGGSTYVPSLIWTRLPWRGCWSSSMRTDPSASVGKGAARRLLSVPPCCCC